MSSAFKLGGGERLSKLDKLLDAHETVVWSGKPVRKAFIPPGLVSIPFGLIFLAFSIFWMINTASIGAPFFFPCLDYLSSWWDSE